MKEEKKIIELVKKSREEIGEERFNELSKKIDEDLKEKLGEEKYRVWMAVNGSEEEEQQLIDEFGKEKYIQYMDEISAELEKELNRFNN